MSDTRAIPGVIAIDPETMGGVPVFAGTRVPIYILLEHLQDDDLGEGIEDFLDGFPCVKRAQVTAFLEIYPETARGNEWRLPQR